MIMIIIGVVSLILGFAYICLVEDKLGINFVTTLCCIGSFCIGAGVVKVNKIDGNPTALDVYQGKTTLQTTYKDGVAIDSVVVFKDAKQ